VDEEGEVVDFQLKETSGNKILDQAALRVAQAFDFTPGLRGDEPAGGWVSLAIVFSGP
jgi:TonB family protein